MDVLIAELEESKVGCNIGHIFCGAMGYADDIILLAPTKSSLLKMLDIAETTAKIYDIIFNASKCKYMYLAWLLITSIHLSLSIILKYRGVCRNHTSEIFYTQIMERKL